MTKSLIDKLRIGIRNTILLGTAMLSLGLASCLTSVANSFKWPQTADDYRGVVVFATNKINSEDNITIQTIMNQLQSNGFSEGGTREYSVQNWLEIQANKYNRDIKIDLERYPNELIIPQKFIDDAGFADDGVPMQFNLKEYADYLRSTCPDLKKYDFIAIECPQIKKPIKGPPIELMGRAVMEKRDGKNYAAKPSEKEFYVTINQSPYATPVPNADVRTYTKKITNGNAVFAHEFLHLLGATDKYVNKNFPYKDDIMYKSDHLFDSVIISPQTAKEIGWNN